MRLNVQAKLLGSSAILLGFTLVIGLLAIVNLASVDEASNHMYDDAMQPLANMAVARAKFNEIRAYMSNHVLEPTAAGKADYDAKIAADDKTIEDELTKFESGIQLDSERTALANVRSTLAAYDAARTDVLALSSEDKQDEAYQVIKDRALPAALDAAKAFQEAFDAELALAATYDTQVQSIFESSRLLIIVLLVVAVALGAALSFILSRRIVQGVTRVQATLGMLADKCATWLAEGMGRLAENDLTYDVQPVTPLIEGYGSDEIGKTAEYTNNLRNKIVASIEAYNAARASLTGTISEVQAAADAVSRTSEQLNEAATQTGAATQQVATTISQVAGGTAEQARAANETNAAVQELSGVIAGVSDGAAQTSHAVTRSLDAVTRMQGALTASDAAAEDMKPANARATEALAKVTDAIAENAAGMARIKTAVDESAVKVAELGAKGEQIGAIVETIDDIAEQTNLLALNAAIEAARAGEMGKGFAVVADEVRKLAERSGRATKEIANLIAEVQKGTQEAVDAMGIGAHEVDQGLVVGQRSSESVLEIGAAAKARDAALDKVFGSLKAIADAAGDVTSSSDDIARIVQQTAAGATQMAASSDSVTRSISSIAAVSEENSAATEEVSAATQEMSAQAEEVVASATTLAGMAQQLDALVARFRLDTDRARGATGGGSADNVVQRRRAADWRSAA